MTATWDPSAGLVTQTFDESRAAIVAKLTGAFGAVNTDTSSVFGQLASIMAEMDTAQQQAMLALWQAMDPAQAQGIALDHIAAITGTVRGPAVAASVVLTFNAANPMMSVPAGTVVTQTATGATWTTQATANLLNPYVEATCDLPGAQAAPAGSAWSLVVADPNVASIANALDGVLGTTGERDSQLRQRRNVELFAASQGPLRSLAGRVSRVEGVKSVRAYHNPATYPVDAFGVPFKAFEVVVEPASSPASIELRQAIARAIWGGMGAGGESAGAESEVITDSESVSQTIKFSLVSPLDVWVKVTLTATGAELATQTAAQAQDVLRPLYQAAAPTLEVPGRDLTSMDIMTIVAGAMASGALTGFVGASVEFAPAIIGPWSAGPYEVTRGEVVNVVAMQLSVVIA